MFKKKKKKKLISALVPIKFPLYIVFLNFRKILFNSDSSPAHFVVLTKISVSSLT